MDLPGASARAAHKPLRAWPTQQAVELSPRTKLTHKRPKRDDEVVPGAQRQLPC